MSNDKRYILEFLLESTHFSKEELENHVTLVLDKYLENIDIEISEQANYLILRIASTEKYVDCCHDKLGFNREWAFRAIDELGNHLRSNSYPILGEIELFLRNFINQAMIVVNGFNWWDSFVPETLREKVKEIEMKLSEQQVKSHHSIEFTFFNDLIGIVTAKLQTWPDKKAITVSDLSELLTTCNSIEDMQREVDKRSKVISLWDTVFSGFFDDKKAWMELRKSIEGKVIPIRNKVMHHRLMRSHELRQLKELRDEVNQVVSLAKTELTDEELKEARQSFEYYLEHIVQEVDSDFFKRLNLIVVPDILKAMNPNVIPDIVEAMNLNVIPDIDKGMNLNVVSDFSKMVNPILPNSITKMVNPTIPENLEGLDLGIDSSTSQEEQDSETDDENKNSDSETDKCDDDNNSLKNEEDDNVK